MSQQHPGERNPIARFRDVYNTLNATNTELLDSLYTQDLEFRDPFRSIKGIGELKTYVKELYSGVESCRFDYEEPIAGDNQVAIAWTMHLRHKKLRPKEEVSVRGVSLLTLREEKICRHVDYFDAGVLVYERVPLLGAIVRAIKKRL